MGQCATLPYQHGQQRQSSSQYYANVVYKETPTSTVAYAMQQQQCPQQGGGHQGGAQARQTDSETTCSANSANSNTPLIQQQQQSNRPSGYQQKYEPPPHSAFEKPDFNAMPPKSPTSTGNKNGMTKKRKSASNINSSNHSSDVVNAVAVIPEEGDTNTSFEQTMIPFVPDGATPKRCFRLNIGEVLPINDLGDPRRLNFSMSEDSSVVTNGKDMVAATAAIFRGLSVTSNGTVITTNDRVVNSARKSKNSKISGGRAAVKADSAAKSRQAAKIDKLKDLVEGKVTPKKASNSAKKKDNNGEEEDLDNTNMLSLVPIGEYFDMKHLVRDGARKLKAVEAGLHVEIETVPQSPNRSNVTSPMSAVADPTTAQVMEKIHVGVPYGSPRANNKYSNQPNSPSASTREMRRNGSKTPPKLNHHPRDPPSSTTPGSRNRSRFQASQCSAFGASEGSDWSEALGLSQGLRSFWNCGNDTYGVSSNKTQHQQPVYDLKSEVYKRAHEKKSHRDYPTSDDMVIDDDRHDNPSSPRREDDSYRNRIDIAMA